MVNGYEKARLALEELIEWTERNAWDRKRNEATTRLHLIDTLIHECLGWAKEDVVVEEHHEATYVDYALGQPSRRVVWEAKKEGVYFELPAGWRADTAKLKTLARLNDDINRAIHQAISYCQVRGIPIGVVSNGHQIIAFIGSRQDGVPPIDGTALVYDSLADIEDRFLQFWNALSKPGVNTYQIFTLLKGEPIPPPEKLSLRLSSYPGFKRRNELQTDLQILGGLFIEDLATAPEIQEDFLRECYLPSGALSQYALVSREILKTRYSVLFENEAEAFVKPAQTKSGVEPDLTTSMLASGLSRRPIILLGDVGVGKTIFIKNLIHVEAKDIFERAIVLYVDFGSEPSFTDDLNTYLMGQFEQQLHDNYGIDIHENGFVRGVYHGDLIRFGRGIYGELRELDPAAYLREELAFLRQKIDDREGHLRASLEHVSKGQQRQVVIFLDNVDQRPFEFQERVFLVAQTLAEKWPATVFVSLRPDTFFRSRSEGFLTAYQPRVFTISPPRVDLVIDRRIRFAQDQLEKTGRLPTFPEDLTVQSGRLAVYLRVLLYSFQANNDLVEFIDNLSGGNVRRALGFVEAFVGSGHVDTRKILEATHGVHVYRIQIHEFMRAVIYGDRQYYDPSSSPIANVFDVSIPDLREHFLVPLLITYSQRTGESSGEEGYVPSATVFEYGQRLGYLPEQVTAALDRCVRKELLEVSPRYTAQESGHHYRVTTVGAYTVHRLICRFAYLDAVVVDTPIMDPALSARITDAGGIRERLARAEFFRVYLDKAWTELAHLDLTFDWSLASKSLRNEAVRIARVADVNLF